MTFKVFCFSLFLLGLSLVTQANPIVDLSGNWKVVDDKSGLVLVHVKISSDAAYRYNGHVIEAFNPPDHPVKDLNKIKGAHLLINLIQDKEDPYQLISGKIFDPASQQYFHITGKVNRNQQMMILRSPPDMQRTSRKVSWLRMDP